LKMNTWSRHSVLTDLTQRSAIALARESHTQSFNPGTPTLRDAIGRSRKSRKPLCYPSPNSALRQARSPCEAQVLPPFQYFGHTGEPSDPALLRRYRLYTRVKAALALPVGPERLAALQAVKVDDRRKH
jgi:hypothetical protein